MAFLWGRRVGGGGGRFAAIAVKVNTRDRIYNVMHERSVKTQHRRMTTALQSLNV